MKNPKKKITPFLWFDNQAEAAAKFYVSIFRGRGSKITDVTRYGGTGPGKKGSVMTISFTLDGQEFVALNGGPVFKFNPSISFFVRCKTQKEVDHFWNKLLKGGKAMECGWLTDKYGLAWQIVPTELGALIGSKDAAKAGRAMKAMMSMVKLDIKALKAAAKGE